MAQWTMRDKILALMDKWYLLLLAFFLSAGLAWGGMHLWPPQHKASLTLYIGIDINRVFDVSSMATYAKSEPFNIDDYKNWQLSQVESIARSEDVARAALIRLREENAFWDSVSVSRFQSMENLAWRDVGTWRLTISAPDPDTASEAVVVWAHILVERVSDLVKEADTAFTIDGDLRALDHQQAQLEAELASIERLQSELREMSSALEGQDAGQLLDWHSRWKLWGEVATAAEFTPMWDRVLDDFPDHQNPVSDYLMWIEKLQVVLTTQQETYQAELAYSESEEERLMDRYLNVIQSSQGLSPNLYIEVSTSRVMYESSYPGPTVAILGGVTGTIGYLVVFLWISASREQQK